MSTPSFHDQNIIHGALIHVLKMSFKKVRTLDLLVAAFLAIVSVVVPFISFLSDNFGGRCCKKRSPYLYAHTFYVLLYSKVEHLPLCLSAVYAVFFFRPLSKAKYIFVVFLPIFH